MTDQGKIIIDQIIAAFQRIRALLFTMTLLCAFLFANAYIEKYSLDEKQLIYSGVLRSQLDGEAAKETDPVKKSILVARIARIDNMLKDYKLRTVSLPLVGLSIPANDANIIVGIFLVALAAWILYSVHQVHDALSDNEMSDDVKSMLPVLRHAAVFVHRPPTTFFKSASANAMFALPSVTMVLVTIEDFLSIVNYDKQPHLANMFPELLARVMILMGILTILAYVSYVLIDNRNKLTQYFYPSNV